MTVARCNAWIGPHPQPMLTAAAMSLTLIAVLNGPNLNLLGSREPEIYGHDTLADIDRLCAETAAELGLAVDCRQTNHEGALISLVQEARDRTAGLIINPAGYTTNSVALLDALLAYPAPIIELHLSNIHRREAFRRNSLVSRAAHGVLCGFGAQGYALALRAMAGLLG